MRYAGSGPPDEDVSRKAKALLLALWNEKDWLKSEFPDRSQAIKEFISKSEHLCMVADLANTLKHRKLNKKRSNGSEVEYVWNSTLAGFRNWDIGIIRFSESEFVSISALFVCSISEFEKLRGDLYGKC